MSLCRRVGETENKPTKTNMSLIKNYRELDVYQNATELTMCKYWDQQTFLQIDQAYEKVLGQIVNMTDQADKWLIKPRGPNV